MDKARLFVPKRNTLMNNNMDVNMEEKEVFTGRSKQESQMDISLSIENKSEAYSVGDPNDINPEAEEEVYQREIKQRQLERIKKEKEEAFEEEEQVNPIIIHLEDWLIEGKWNY